MNAKELKELEATVDREVERLVQLEKVTKAVKRLREAKEDDRRNLSARLEGMHFRETGRFVPIPMSDPALESSCCIGGRSDAKGIKTGWPRCESCFCCENKCKVHGVLKNDTPVSLSDSDD